MIILKKLLESVKSIEGYKSQFAANENPNILFVDPVLSSHDYYTMILPALALNTFDLANIAFTDLSKFIESNDRKPLQNLTAAEVVWGNSIVFPFSLVEYRLEENHLFDIIKKTNPAIKIFTVIESDFSSKSFFEDFYSNLEDPNKKTKKNEIKQFVDQQILENIKRSDILICHSFLLKTKIEKYLSDNNLEIPVKKVPLLNSKALIFEGIEETVKNYQLNDPNNIKVYVDFTDTASQSKFKKNVLKNAPENVTFFSRNCNIVSPNLKTFRNCTISHFYKEIYQNSYDYYLIYGSSNEHKISQFHEGKILDFCYFGGIPVVINPNIFKSLDIKIGNLTHHMKESDFVELLKLNDFDERYKLSKQKLTGSENFECNEITAKVYYDLFL